MSGAVKEREWIYSQSKGILWLREGDETKRVGVGYSGHPPYVNDPTAQALKARGPIPSGVYRVGRPFDHVRLGPVVFFLDPDVKNNMHGRSGFFIHGDNEYGNNSASHGCIILKRSVRERIRIENVRRLVVV